VMGNLLIEAESGKPAPGQMHLQFLDQLALAGDLVEIPVQFQLVLPGFTFWQFLYREALHGFDEVRRSSPPREAGIAPALINGLTMLLPRTSARQSREASKD
jgi:hypothetical protein